MLDILGPRPADQIVSRTVRITLAGQSYELPVRSIRANREWKERLNAKTAGLLSALDDTDELPAVLALLADQAPDLVEMLCAYDTSGKLPSADEILDLEPDPSVEVLAAVREVWRVANPLAATALATVQSVIQTSPSSPPTSTPPPPTATRRRKSKTN